jgi:hypothetical protein
MKSISSASKLRQWQVWRTEICAAKIRKFSRISEKSAASAKYPKNPRRRIVLVNDLLQIGFSPALPSSSISASSFDLKNYTGKPVSFETAISVAFAFRDISSSSASIQRMCFSRLLALAACARTEFSNFLLPVWFDLRACGKQCLNDG